MEVNDLESKRQKTIRAVAASLGTSKISVELALMELERLSDLDKKEPLDVQELVFKLKPVNRSTLNQKYAVKDNIPVPKGYKRNRFN